MLPAMRKFEEVVKHPTLTAANQEREWKGWGKHSQRFEAPRNEAPKKAFGKRLPN